MLFYCAYTWFPNTRPEAVWERVIHQHERGANAPELIRGWYDLAGGGAGFLIVETDDVRELTAMLRPSGRTSEPRRVIERYPSSSVKMGSTQFIAGAVEVRSPAGGVAAEERRGE